MKIAKPMLLITTPIGVFGSIYWADRLAGGLVILLIALFLMIAAAFVQLIMTARREAREQNNAATTPHTEHQTIVSITQGIRRR